MGAGALVSNGTSFVINPGASVGPGGALVADPTRNMASCCCGCRPSCTNCCSTYVFNISYKYRGIGYTPSINMVFHFDPSYGLFCQWSGTNYGAQLFCGGGTPCTTFPSQWTFYTGFGDSGIEIISTTGYPCPPSNIAEWSFAPACSGSEITEFIINSITVSGCPGEGGTTNPFP
jgi:hypothetical protein